MRTGRTFLADRTRTRLRLCVFAGFALAAIGDATQPYDGPGPFVFAGIAVLALCVPWWLAAPIAVLLGGFFSYGALANPQLPAMLAAPGATGAFLSGLAELVGLVAGSLGGLALGVHGLRRGRRVPLPHNGTRP